MAGSCYLYIMLSRTDTGIGRIIRKFSHYPYNHVSLSTDATFRTWYSFARYFENAPFYGGFLREPAERFLARGSGVPVRIFRVRITPEHRQRLEQLFRQADRPDSGLRYNYYDALATVFRKQVRIPGAYTCLSFCCAVLGRHYPTIEALNAGLADYLIYDGKLSALVADSGDRSDRYFMHISNSRGLWASACSLGSVTRRLLWHGSEDLLRQRLHSTVF